MPVPSHILAAHDSSYEKLFIFAIVAVIWAIQAIANLAKGVKKQQQAKTPPPPMVATPMAPPPPAPAGSGASGKQLLCAPRAVKPATTAGAMRLPPLPTLVRQAVPAQPASTARPAVAPAPAQVTAPVAAPRRAGLQWIDRQTVRSQFVLAEALQPPLALRKKSHLP